MAEAGGPIEILASEQAAVAAAAAAAPPARFARLDRILALATEIPAAVLVSVEVSVLLAGVVSRYVFNQPLTWTDELASILFLWLAMLGAVIALRRDEHMRLGGLVALAPGVLRPGLIGLGNYNLLVFFVGMVAVCVAIGVPIAFAFGVATLSYLALVTGAPLTIVTSRMDEGMSTLILLSVPLFVFLGALIEMTGLARAMVDFLATLLGHVRGGLQYVLLAAMYLVSGISGSKAADMAAVAPALFPEMKRRGANEGDLIALLSSSGAMSETIPPSLVLITIGSVTGVSIAALFNG